MLRKLALFVAASLVLANSSTQAIQHVLSDQVQAWNRGEIDAFMNGYENSPDTVFIESTVRRGYEAVRRRYQEHYPTRKKMGKLTFSNVEIHLLDAD